MANELEKQFFQCFGVEPKPLFSTRNGYTDDHYIYPTISDRILLELICILNTVTVPDLGDINTGRLKNTILEECINALTKVDWENRTPTKEEFINEIKTLFEER